MTSKLNVGGHMVILSGGKANFGKDSEVEVEGSLQNSGTLNVGENQLLGITCDALRAVKSVVDLGTEVFKKIN